MSSHKQRKFSRLKKAVSVALMGTVCLTAAVSVAALTQTFEVCDGNVVVGSKPENNENIIPIDDASFGKTVSEKALDAFDTSAVSESSITMNIKANEEPAFSAKGEKNNNKSNDSVKDNKKNNIVWCSVKVNLRGKEESKKVPQGTVKDVLAYLNIKLTDKDSVNLKNDYKIKNGDKIVITRTVVVEDTEVKDINFKTVTKESSTLFEGDTKVDTEGEKGKKEVTVEKTYVNGKLTKKEETGSEVIEEPVDKVVLKGTAEKTDIFAKAENGEEVKADEDSMTFTDAEGNEREYLEIITGSGTAYYADAGALTSTGRLAAYGVVAVNPDIIPYGSKLYIVSNDGEVVYGEAVAGDTGGALIDGSAIVDLFYPTYDECCTFGRRNVTIYVLEYGNEFR